MGTPTLRTPRLVLRGWREADIAPFAALNADTEVMEHFPRTLSRPETEDFVRRIRRNFEVSGWGLWAVEVPGSSPFVGFVGLWPADHVQLGLVEVGWRLSRGAWGHGYAPEAATEALRFGFEEVGLDEIASFTTPANSRSWRVMEKIGLHRQPTRDFDHPNVDRATHPALVRHVFYGLTRAEWSARRRSTEDSAPSGRQPPTMRGSTTSE